MIEAYYYWTVRATVFNANFNNISFILWRSVLLVEDYHMIEAYYYWTVRATVFNATFNNISAISWRSVLLVEETEVPRENYRPVGSH
jgi:hypothetical protein